MTQHPSTPAPQNPQTTAFLFPGQGSQSPGMAATFMDAAPTRDLFGMADETLKTNLSKLMREGDEAELRQTENAQPALLLAGVAAYTYLAHGLKRDLPQLAQAVAGHSLGEYTAVAVAGGLPWLEMLQLVRLRGQAMAKAVPVGQGSMSAVLGLTPEALQQVAAANGVVVANDNAPGQVILSGPVEALAKAEEAAKGAGAKRVLRLNVAGPFHTPAMAPAAEAVQAFLAEHPLANLSVPCTMNATATPTNEGPQAATNLVAQITSPVRWRESMVGLAESGITQVVEFGAGKVLSAMAPRCDARLSAVALDSVEAVEAYASTL